MSYLVSGTPFEVYQLDGIDIHVKREDLCCLPPGPAYSKMRGLELYLGKLKDHVPVCAFDTGYHSRSGWGLAYMCNKTGRECYVGYAVGDNYNQEHCDLKKDYLYQYKAQELGAKLLPISSRDDFVGTYSRAKAAFLLTTDGAGIMLPARMKLDESVLGAALEAKSYTPAALRCGTWIVAISSGTTAAGVLRGLKECSDNITFLCYFGNSRNEEETRQYMCDIAGYEPDSLIYIDDGWNYDDEAPKIAEFPASVYYEAKAWGWLRKNIRTLRQPIVFWNIGS